MTVPSEIIETYKGYEITLRKGFLSKKLVARNEDDDVHSRMFPSNQPRRKHLQRLRDDIDRWGDV